MRTNAAAKARGGGEEEMLRTETVLGGLGRREKGDVAERTDVRTFEEKGTRTPKDDGNEEHLLAAVTIVAISSPAPAWREALLPAPRRRTSPSPVPE